MKQGRRRRRGERERRWRRRANSYNSIEILKTPSRTDRKLNLRNKLMGLQGRWRDENKLIKSVVIYRPGLTVSGIQKLPRRTRHLTAKKK